MQSIVFSACYDLKYFFSISSGRMMCMGVIMGPFNHGWYTFLDKVLPGATSSTVVKKIFLDQIVASPYFAFSFFIGKAVTKCCENHDNF